MLAASSFVAAAERAAGRYEVEDAERYLAEAIELHPTAAAYTTRARVRMSRLALSDAAGDAAEAISLGGGAAALEAAGWVAYYRRRYDEAQAFADEAIALASDDASIRVSALALTGRIRHGAGDLDDAVTRLTSVGDAPLAVRGVADTWLAQARVHQGRPLDALSALSRPSVDPDSLAHPWAPLHLRFTRAMALGQLGRVQEGVAVITDLAEVAGRAGSVGLRFEAVAANGLAWFLRWSGRGAEADERNQFALELTGGTSGPAGEALAEPHYVALLDLLDGALLRNDVAAARTWLTPLAAVDHWTGTMAWHQRHRLQLGRARLAIASGDHATAVDLASAVAVDAGARGANRYELLALAVAGIADASVPVSRLAPVVEGLARCAALEGWLLVDELARVRDVDDWRREAERRAASIVTASDDPDATRRFVDRVLRV